MKLTGYGTTDKALNYNFSDHNTIFHWLLTEAVYIGSLGRLRVFDCKL